MGWDPSGVRIARPTQATERVPAAGAAAPHGESALRAPALRRPNPGWPNCWTWTEYRSAAAAGRLRTIAPRRCNPHRVAWLPVLHTQRGARHYTALFSNTARVHELYRTHDWVVLYVADKQGGRQYTVITTRRGVLKGRRVVRGREVDCLEYYYRRGLKLPWRPAGSDAA